MRDKILDSVFEFKNKKTNEIIEIKSKEFIDDYQVLINGIKLKKTSDFIISYKCIHCNKNNTIGTSQFLRKIRRNTEFCLNCENKNNNEQKSFIDKHKKSVNEFNLLDDLFINSYNLSHLTEDDYERIKPNIQSFCNGTLTDIDNYEFWSVFKIGNQLCYNSILYDKINDKVFKINQPIIKCDICLNLYKFKSLECLKNCYKIICQNCKLLNNTLVLKSIKNTLNEKIIYKSKLEKKFIEHMNSLNLVVKNGLESNFIVNDLLIDIWHKNKRQTNTKNIFITPHNWKYKIKCFNKK